MGIEDPGLSKIIIVVTFLAFMILILYYVKSQGKGLLSKLNHNQLLSVEETVAISNICKASIISADKARFLIIHGKGQPSTAVKLPNKIHVADLNKENIKVINNEKDNFVEKV